jgi:hypothetical protein
MLKRSAQMALAISYSGCSRPGPLMPRRPSAGRRDEAAGKRASSLHQPAREVGGGSRAHQRTRSRVPGQFNQSFTKAESKPPCATTGDVFDQANLDRGRRPDRGEPRAPPPTCQSAKLRPRAKEPSVSLARRRGDSEDHRARLLGASRSSARRSRGRVELRCGTAPGAAAVEAQVDALDADVVCELDPAGSTCD